MRANIHPHYPINKKIMDEPQQSTAQSGIAGNKKMLIYGGIALAVVIVIIIIVVLLVSSSNIAVPNAVPNVVPNVVPNAPVANAPKGDFFWSYKPEGGLTFDEAKEGCANAGGRLATRQELIRAGEDMGFQLCAAGWLQKTDGNPDAGYYMQAKYSGCGNAGFNGWQTNPTLKLGSYCVGTTRPPAANGRYIVDYNALERFRNVGPVSRQVYGL